MSRLVGPIGPPDECRPDLGMRRPACQPPSVRVRGSSRVDPRRWRLATRFAVASAAILCVGAVILGVWVTREIETSVLRRVAADSALYVEALVGPRLQGLVSGTLSAEERVALEDALGRAARGRIVSIKIWDPDGTIAYATDPALVGRRFASRGLAVAAGGSVVSRRSDLRGEENEFERALAPSLIETYVPLRDPADQRVVAVAEFYQIPDLLQAELDRARLSTWSIIAVATALMYGLLAGMVRRGSDTIEWQSARLEETTARLRELSAARAQTEEEQRRRVARELHDGLTQDLATALLTLDRDDTRRTTLARTAIESALTEVRSLARGLALPDLAGLDLGAVVERACSEHERKIGRHVTRDIGPLPREASPALKIAAYRILQEALVNSFRHASGADVSVRAAAHDGWLQLECSDRGPGFGARPEEGLGIRGMRERAELLGGRIEIGADDGTAGTIVRASLPVSA